MGARSAIGTQLNSTAARRLCLEVLEDRRLLSAGAPYQNPAFTLDVNHNGNVSSADVNAIITKLLESGSGLLPAPVGTPEKFYDTTGDNYISPRDALKIINRLNRPPVVTVNTSTPFVVDVTPQVNVKITSPVAVPDFAPVTLDVDLNNDGNFSGTIDGKSETNYAQGQVFHNVGTFDFNHALPLNTAGPQTIKIRARLQDSDGVEGVSAPWSVVVDTGTNDILKTYVNAVDLTTTWSLAGTYHDPNGEYDAYFIDLKSQTWRNPGDVNRRLWQHYVSIIVPKNVVTNTAMLLIDGGSNGGGPPSRPNEILVDVALAEKSVVVELPTVPNEPLTFLNPFVPGASEDLIIAYSYDQFMTHLHDNIPGNDNWPALEAMVKSAKVTMDTVQEFMLTKALPINDFLVSGYSKRGWTTWLTAAIDPRVKAMIPGVFDNLNQGPSMVHHYGVYGKFAEAVGEYAYFHVFDRILTEEGQALSKIVDPYTYLHKGRFDNMPKLMINSPGDQFFVSDSGQFYIKDIPGDKNFIRYIPNVDHGLGLDQGDRRVVDSSISFYDAIIHDRALPKYSFDTGVDGKITLITQTQPTKVLLWQLNNPAKRDFRKDFFDKPWTATVVPPTQVGGNTYFGNVPVPPTGATAYFLEMTFDNPGDPANPYVFTTDVHVQSNLPLAPWPFPFALPTAVAASADASSANFNILGATSPAAVVEISSSASPSDGLIAGVALRSPGGSPASSADGFTLTANSYVNYTPSVSVGASTLTVSAIEPQEEGDDDEEPHAELVDGVFACTDPDDLTSTL